MIGALIISCLAATLAFGGQLSPPGPQRYIFTPSESRVLPGKTAENRVNAADSEQDRIGPVALGMMKYQGRYRVDGSYNHGSFPVEVGRVAPVGQEKQFEAFRLKEPLRKATRFLGPHHVVFYRFPSKERWSLYRLDDSGVTPVTVIAESEIIPGQYTRIMGLGASKVTGSETYFIAPAATRISNYSRVSSDAEAAKLAETPLGSVLAYRHAIDGAVPDHRRRRDSYSINRQFFFVKDAGGSGIIWQDKKNLSVRLTRFSADLQSSSTATLTTGRPGRLLAACSDPSGNLYCLLAREKKDTEMLELVKTDAAGKLLTRSVLDTSRDNLNIFELEKEFTPAELAWSSGRLCMMLGRTMHKAPDGLNHQGGIAVLFDAANLRQIKNLGQTSSHSFENLLLVNAAGEFIGIDLGDGYPRGGHLHRFTDAEKVSRVVYTFKTSHGQSESNPAGRRFPPYPEISRPDKTFFKWSNDNSTYSQLGGLIETADGYMVIFSGEPSPEGRVLDNSRLEPGIEDRRIIGLVVAVKDFHKTPSLGNVIPDELLLTRGLSETGGFYSFIGSWIEQRSTGIVWHPGSSGDEGKSAYNIKTALLPDGSILVLWITYQAGGMPANWAMTVSASGKQLVAPFRLPDQIDLNRRDAVMVDGNRVYIASGDRDDKRLELFVLQLK